jgi:hypothetical protein
MNVFILSTNPIEAAQLQCDKHVPKMVVESAQMLSTAHRMLDGEPTRKPSKSGKTMVKYYEMVDDSFEDILYKAVHMGHPCTVWTMQTAANYRWHYDHFAALCDEYTYRYGKVHKSDRDLRDILISLPRNISDIDELLPFPLAMKSNPECMFDDPVKSYRAFYQTKQHRFSMKWTKRPVPEWFKYADLHAA